MILIACVDDGLGMAFNRRRQSRDRLLRERILAVVKGAPLWMSPYSAGQFGQTAGSVRVDEAFLTKAGAQEFAFTELDPPGFAAARIEQVVLYRWNRSYPADLRFDLPLEAFSLLSRTDFPGFSHPKITEEIYVR